jgi:LysR family transcriptional regulator for bpeEF and oprC
MSDLNEALMFVTVVEKGSFTAAARTLGVPKATLSRKVQALEERLGSMLLKRTTRRLGLTESGQVFYAHCARVPRLLEDAAAAVIQLSGTPRGWLRVTAPYTLGAQIIVPLVPEFMARYPDVRIDMHLSNEVVDLVASDLDLALRVGTLADSSLVARQLGRFSTHVFASPDYLARYGEPLLPADVVHHRALALSTHRHHGRFCWTLSDGTHSEELNIAPVLVMNEPSALRNAALAGLGLTMLPDRLALPHEQDGTLQRLLRVWAGPVAELNAVFPRERVLPPKVRAFIDFLVERLSFPLVSAVPQAPSSSAN